MANTTAQVIQDLIARGLTEAAIAERVSAMGVPVSQPTINRLKLGKHARTSYEIGTALRSLLTVVPLAKPARRRGRPPRV
jgi:hypothetical protein